MNKHLKDNRDRISFTSSGRILTPYREYKPKLTLGEVLVIIIIAAGLLGVLLWQYGVIL